MNIVTEICPNESESNQNDFVIRIKANLSASGFFLSNTYRA